MNITIQNVNIYISSDHKMDELKEVDSLMDVKKVFDKAARSVNVDVKTMTIEGTQINKEDPSFEKSPPPYNHKQNRITPQKNRKK